MNNYSNFKNTFAPPFLAVVFNSGTERAGVIRANIFFYATSGLKKNVALIKKEQLWKT
jgi:hypothetical protein